MWVFEEGDVGVWGGGCGCLRRGTWVFEEGDVGV